MKEGMKKETIEKAQEKMRETRERKEAEKVLIELVDGWVMESYEYGWRITKGSTSLFFLTVGGALGEVWKQCVRKTGKKTMEEHLKAEKELLGNFYSLAYRIERMVEGMQK